MLLLSLLLSCNFCGVLAKDDTCGAQGCLGQSVWKMFQENAPIVAAAVQVGTDIYKANQQAKEEQRRMEESVTISMKSDLFEKRGTIHYFGIEVAPKSSKNTSAPWKVYHRYSDFRALQELLGPTSDFNHAPFPGKSLLAMSSEDIEERRKALEVWLSEVVDHIDSKGPWYEELQAFLEPTIVTKARNEVSIALDGSTEKTGDGTHFFSIIINPKGVAGAYSVARRYSEFLNLKTSLGDQADRFENALFPGKKWYMNEQRLEERRRRLELWLQTALAHPDSQTVWAPRIRDFLDPQCKERQNRTQHLVQERAKERGDDDLEVVQQDAALDTLFNEMGGDTILDGVKEALITSMERAVELCSGLGSFLKDPKIKIPLPKEVALVLPVFRKIGLRSFVDNIEEQITTSINEAAAKAVPATVGIFKILIRELKISDVKNLWMSKKQDACTRYLKRTSYQDMKQAMAEVARPMLKEKDLMKYWEAFVAEVAHIPIIGNLIASYDVADYVVEKGLDGLFRKMAIEEEKIRRAPGTQSSLISKVFSAFR